VKAESEYHSLCFVIEAPRVHTRVAVPEHRKVNNASYTRVLKRLTKLELSTVGRELTFGRWITVGLCSRLEEILLANCCERPGVDLLLCSADGCFSLVSMAGSDSPSNPDALGS
jgi:hypothetical protein